MGRVFSSFVKRPLRNWNVENRAQRVLDKEKAKPKAAPRHSTTTEMLHKFSKDNPEFLQAQKTKDTNLDSMLKGIIVNPDKVGEIVSRPLPTNRAILSDPEFGYLEPDRIPPGKCSIRQALEFISNYQGNPESLSVAEIAKSYKLDPGQVRRVLLYFHTLHIQIPTRTRPDHVGDGSASKATPLAPSIGKLLRRGKDEKGDQSSGQDTPGIGQR